MNIADKCVDYATLGGISYIFKANTNIIVAIALIPLAIIFTFLGLYWQLGIIVILAVLNFLSYKYFVKVKGIAEYHQILVDEILGILITVVGASNWPYVLLGFIVYRFVVICSAPLVNYMLLNFPHELSLILINILRGIIALIFLLFIARYLLF